MHCVGTLGYVRRAVVIFLPCIATHDYITPVYIHALYRNTCLLHKSEGYSGILKDFCN